MDKASVTTSALLAAVSRPVHRQLGKFAIVGISNTLISAVVYLLLLALGVWYVAAAVAAYFAGMVNGYTWNRRWTFRAGRFHGPSFARYVIVQATGLGLTVALVILFVESLGVPKALAQLLAAPPVVALTFTGNRRWTFGHVGVEPEQGEPRPTFRGSRELLAAAALCGLAAAALYGAHVARGGWYYDDWAFVAMLDLPAERGTGPLLEAAWDSSYRPGYALIFLVMYLVGGTGQAPYLLFGVAFTALEATLAYVVARLLGATRTVAGAVAVLLLAIPTHDATRLWTAAFPTTWAVCLFLLGLALALQGLRSTERSHAIAWHAGAVAAYTLGMLTSELLMSVVPLAVLLYALAGGRRRALRRWVPDLLATAASLAYVAVGASGRRPADGSLDHLIGRIDETLAGARDVFRDTLPASGLLWGPVGVVLAAAAAAGVVLAVRRGGSDRRAALHWLAIAAGGIGFAFAGLVMLLPAEPYYVPRLEGVGNRFTAVSALGHVVLLVALAYLAGVGLSALARRGHLAGVVALALVAATAAGMVRTEVRHQDAWAESWEQSQDVMGAVRRALGPEIPRNSRVVTFNHPYFIPTDVPIFAASWDLQGAVRLLYRDPTLDAQPFNPSFSCEADGLGTRAPGAVGPPDEVMPYGDLYVVDAVSYRGRRIPGRAACDAWRNAFGI